MGNDTERLLITRILPRSNPDGTDPWARVGALCRILKETDNRYSVEVVDLGDFETHRQANIQGSRNNLYIEAEHVLAVGVTRDQHDRLKRAWADFRTSMVQIHADQDEDPELQRLKAEVAAAQQRFEEGRRRYRDRIPQRRVQLDQEIADILGDTVIRRVIA